MTRCLDREGLTLELQMLLWWRILPIASGRLECQPADSPWRRQGMSMLMQVGLHVQEARCRLRPQPGLLLGGKRVGGTLELLVWSVHSNRPNRRHTGLAMQP